MTSQSTSKAPRVTRRANLLKVGVAAGAIVVLSAGAATACVCCPNTQAATPDDYRVSSARTVSTEGLANPGRAVPVTSAGARVTVAAALNALATGTRTPTAQAGTDVAAGRLATISRDDSSGVTVVAMHGGVDSRADSSGHVTLHGDTLL